MSHSSTKKARDSRDEKVLCLHITDKFAKKTNKPILYLIYFISLGMKNVFISQRFISRKLDMVPPSP